MNEKFNKALLDVVIATANDLGKHHANETLELIEAELVESFDTQAKTINDLVELVKGAESSTDNVRLEIGQLVKRLSELHVEFKQNIDDTNNAVNGNVTSLSDDITGIKDGFDILCGDVDDKHKELTELVNTIGEAATESNNISSDTFEKFIVDFGVINEQIQAQKNSLIGNADDLSELSKTIHFKFIDFDNQIKSLSEDYESVASFVDSSMEQVAGDVKTVIDDIVVKFDELKSESFLSSDKIDMKFAELRLANIEADVERTAAIKESVAVEMRQREQSLETALAEHQRNVGDQITSDTQAVIDNVELMLLNDKSMLNRAKSWESGSNYGTSVIVRNLGGVWQSLRTTDDEPTVYSEDWICLYSSFHKMVKIEDHPNGVQTVFGLHDSLGNVHELSVPVPTVRYLKGVYDPTDTYEHLDSIMKDGCRWVATKDNPDGLPGEDDADWQVLHMRGPKGMKGATGERGPRGLKGDVGDPGPMGLSVSVEDVVKEIESRNSQNGIPIKCFRGPFVLGTTYSKGDLTVGENGEIILCTNDNHGALLPMSDAKSWVCLFKKGV